MNLEILRDNSLGIIKNEFEKTRIGSTDDVNLNNILFSLYKQLINPVREIEMCEDEIYRKQTDVARLNSKTYCYFKEILRLSIPFGIAAMVIVFVLAFLDETHPIVVAAEEYTRFIDTILGIITDAGVPGIIGFIVYMLMLFGGLYLIPIPIPIAIVILKNHLSKSNDKKNVERINEEIKNIEDDVKKRISAISEVIRFVPPEYRNSQALSYFVESYANSRVNNLKEAVNAWDQKVHQRNTEMKLEELTSIAQAIEYNQFVQIDQLKRLNKNIWRTEIIF